MQEIQGTLWDLCVCVCVCVCVYSSPIFREVSSIWYMGQGGVGGVCLDNHSYEQLPSAVPQGREAAWEPVLTVEVDAPAGKGRGWVPLASIAISFVNWR